MVKITLIHNDSNKNLYWYGYYQDTLHSSLRLLDWRFTNYLDIPKAVKIEKD